MRLEVALPAKGLPALRTGVDLRHSRVLLLPVSEEGALALEDLAAVKAREVAHGAVVLAVVLCDVGHRDELGRFHRRFGKCFGREFAVSNTNTATK